MGEKDLKKVNLEGTVKYDIPTIITLSGLPGSGKTSIARILSKELKMYLLSNDYIRNYYYQLTSNYSEEKRLQIQDKVYKINLERLLKILFKRASFIYDRDFNKESDFNMLLQISKILKMQLIKIKINSEDIDNINRIKNTIMDYNKVYEGVIGDNVEYLSSFPEDVYYQIKERKPQLLSDDYFDYVINNTSISKEDLNCQIYSMIYDIKYNRLKRR